MRDRRMRDDHAVVLNTRVGPDEFAIGPGDGETFERPAALTRLQPAVNVTKADAKSLSLNHERIVERPRRLYLLMIGLGQGPLGQAPAPLLLVSRMQVFAADVDGDGHARVRLLQGHHL